MDKQVATVLVINPGTTSTKVAVFRDDKEIHSENIEYTAAELAAFDLVSEQFDLRLKGIEKWLETIPENDRSFDAVAGRGAPLKPLEGGTYTFGEKLLDDVKTSRYSNHASNLGPMLADYFSKKFKVPAYFTDPITVDNFTDLARLSGFPEIVRKSRSHALNIKAVGRAEAAKAGRTLEDMNFIVAHMGNGVSIAALEMGLIVDVNDGLLGMGPFSPDRAGALPIGALVELCYSGKYEQKELEKALSKKSGMMGYLGVNDLRQVEEMIAGGDQNAETVFNAMCYQIAKEIGAVSAALKGNIDGIILTGGMARSIRLTEMITAYVKFIAPVKVVPGEHEMKALAEGAMRALKGLEQVKVYD